MDYTTYKIIHLIGIAALALGVGGMIAGGGHRKTFAILQGIALVVMLVSGFGLLARLHLGFPHFAMAKLVVWVIIGMLPMLLRRLRVPPLGGICILLALVGIMAWLGVVKPPLW
jgi:membrane associated rhomboid family serine protease